MLFSPHIPRIPYLYHLTSLINLSSIFEHGLLSHHEAHRRGLVAADLSEDEVQDRRRLVTLGRARLHEYVPLYFTPRNPMLYARREAQESIVLLGVAPRLLLYPDTLVTDGNAAARETAFYRGPDALDHLPWNVLNAHYWSGFRDGKRKRCAEALVYGRVPVDEMLKVFCYSEDAKRAVRAILCSLPEVPGVKRITFRHLEVNRSLYFDD